MFKVEKSKNLKWPVTVCIPRDGGKVTKATFTGEFVILDQDEFDTTYQDGGDDRDLCQKILVGWGGDLADENGEPMPFSEEARATLIKIAYVRAAVVKAYLECSNGREAARKN